MHSSNEEISLRTYSHHGTKVKRELFISKHLYILLAMVFNSKFLLNSIKTLSYFCIGAGKSTLMNRMVGYWTIIWSVLPALSVIIHWFPFFLPRFGTKQYMVEELKISCDIIQNIYYSWSIEW